MAQEARPSRLELPLAGGTPGATVRLHPLLAAEVLMPPAFNERPSGPLRLARGLGLFTPRSRWNWVPVPCFLVEHPTAGPFLIDTGIHPSVVDRPAENLGRRGALMYRVRMTRDQAIGEQLRAHGLASTDIKLVVMTHLHFDHASGISEFPGATFVVSAAEWESATTHGVLRGYHRSHFHPLYDWRTIDYSGDAVESHEDLGRAVDLFGDGSVRLAFTPGHSMGHQSVLLRLDGREAILTGDAAYSMRTVRESVIPTILADEHLFLRSLKEIQRYLEPRPDAVVIPGHDPELWPSLKPVYD